jgi:hypothetical protein
VLETLDHLIKDDQALLKKRSENAALLGKPQSAFDIAKILWNAALQGKASAKPRKARKINTEEQKIDQEG